MEAELYWEEQLSFAEPHVVHPTVVEAPINLPAPAQGLHTRKLQCWTTRLWDHVWATQRPCLHSMHNPNVLWKPLPLTVLSGFFLRAWKTLWLLGNPREEGCKCAKAQQKMKLHSSLWGKGKAITFYAPGGCISEKICIVLKACK